MCVFERRGGGAEREKDGEGDWLLWGWPSHHLRVWSLSGEAMTGPEHWTNYTASSSLSQMKSSLWKSLGWLCLSERKQSADPPRKNEREGAFPVRQQLLFLTFPSLVHLWLSHSFRFRVLVYVTHLGKQTETHVQMTVFPKQKEGCH